MIPLNETHAPSEQSWLDSANDPQTDFPLQNLPFASFQQIGESQQWRGGIAIGDQVLDLKQLAQKNLLQQDAQRAIELGSQRQLNELMGARPQILSALRKGVWELLRVGSPSKDTVQDCLIPQKNVEYQLPARIGDYTDFYASIHHATNVGSLFRPDNPLLPNYRWVPIGYHGRSSSIGISGQNFHRPLGQVKGPQFEVPSLRASSRLDYELEVGIFIGQANDLGQPLSMEEAEEHIFGLCLLNDWSARDIQAWEYQPLGPFLAKNFATTISPWIVTMEALAPYRTQWTRETEDPQPLDYLESVENRASGGIDLCLEVYLETLQMRKDGQAPTKLSASNFKESYWTAAQLVTHHAIGGCNLQPGDLLGSGTQSGPTLSEAGSLLELSKGGKEAITLDNGETRTFLEDGDTVILRGYCARAGYLRIGFGEVRGTVLPALSK